MLFNKCVLKKNIKLFDKLKIFNPHELECRSHVLYESFIKQVQLEANCLIDMLDTGVIPSCIEDLSVGQNVKSSKAFGKIVSEKDRMYSSLVDENDKLRELYEKFPEDAKIKDQAEYCDKKIRPQMVKVRAVCDKVERMVSEKLWPFPKYDSILYDHHVQGEKEFQKK